MAELRWLDEREAHLWQAYRHLQRELRDALDRQLLRDAGLSGADYALLVPLSESPDGLLRARDLGALVGWDRPRISHQLTRMEQRGLVARERCPDDARGSMVRLTPTGRSAIEAAAPKHVTTVRRFFIDPLSDDELDTLTTLLDRLLAGLADREVD
ncbi:MAG TPA: MarR family transcriptional regulator [Acidimicrobiia bacterium]